MKNEETKNLEGQEQETGEQTPETKTKKSGIVKKVFTIGSKVVTGGMAALGCYALFKALAPEKKTGSTDATE